MSIAYNMINPNIFLNSANALLVITTLVNSTVTVEKNGIILTPWLNILNENSSQINILFNIPATIFDNNEWTITGVRNNLSTTSTIIINSAKIYEIEIPYRLYLYHNGENNNLTATKIYGSTGSVNLTNTDNILTCYNNYSSGQYGITAFYGTGTAIDITNYKKIVVTITEATKQTASNQASRFGVNNSMSGEMTSWSWDAVQWITTAVNTETTYNLDITSATGSKKIGFGTFSGSAVKTIYVKIKDFYLEQ